MLHCISDIDLGRQGSGVEGGTAARNDPSVAESKLIFKWMRRSTGMPCQALARPLAFLGPN